MKRSSCDWIHGAACDRRDDQHDFVLAQLARHRNRRRLAHVRMLAASDSTSNEEDVLAAPAIASFMRSTKEEVALLVAAKARRPCGTSRCATRSHRRFRILVVALRDFPRPRGAQISSPNRSGRNFHIVLVDDATLDAGPRRPQVQSTGGFACERNRRRQLGHVERRVHLDAEALRYCERILVPRHSDHCAQRMVAIATRSAAD
jgi:hypothetical protein